MPCMRKPPQKPSRGVNQTVLIVSGCPMSGFVVGVDTQYLYMRVVEWTFSFFFNAPLQKLGLKLKVGDALSRSRAVSSHPPIQSQLQPDLCRLRRRRRGTMVPRLHFVSPRHPLADKKTARTTRSPCMQRRARHAYLVTPFLSWLQDVFSFMSAMDGCCARKHHSKGGERARR
jgi:hypothetical protein